ncbi:PAB0415 family putative ATP pyrophosphatase [Pyrococcus abyssi]|uniref:N-type ATP pyrophosphatase superfamily n=1 Tax=Pyrococcus abyssi (strain GE5 / Orsay) TaxID=272844 RepID=Q9V125_PYRAB|nr:diphthine--ammonia ligase [Pyrococcus abyssi]CAB49526.1 Predicted ATPases of PP-loop superfamily [Pyrococcus abyssi GE5]CCE69996.1 TPA: N-type ATP pyrophosphatase superfamily [Pyrococcus abyssi GE5]
MRGIALFSGGKDGLYAVYLAEKEGIDVPYLLLLKTTIGLSPHWENRLSLRKLANSMGKAILTFDMAEGSDSLVELLSSLSVDVLIAGDVYLEDHKSWLESLGEKAGIKVFEPLWGRDSRKLAEEMLKNGFKWAIIAVDKSKLPRSVIGYKFSSSRDLDRFLANYDVDPLGEYGEFHTVVLSSPLFDRDFELKIDDVLEDKTYYWAKFTLL